MTPTKSQKIYFTIMLLAAAAFAWDRLSSGPASAEAKAQPTDPGLTTSVVAPSPLPEAPPANDALKRRLAQIARDHCLSPGAPDDAFGLPPDWEPVKPPDPAAVAKPAPEVEANRLLAQAFRGHHLDAVIVGQRGYANVDGQGVFVGESFDKFTLLSVTKSSAIFGLDSVRVELKLSADASADRTGAGIQNAAPRRPDGSNEIHRRN